ncbi:diaminopimelate decarboxylase [Fodinisporobacter ferrooxydans]|uniref:Diaminopimelate decarboxylase n=1 Tax=Fodinisporobacter ferrooxydans TaxID=2901836 RepID=A0ABY4CIN2_9BACL|nr:diaminopimelate decarboxylase [Alicyclobacillaceae bacterium MYW30-H2]
MYLHGTSKRNEHGQLSIGGVEAVELAKQFGTPLYVYDEQLLRDNCRAYIHAFQQSGMKFQVTYASKAFCTMAMCKLVEQEGLGLDVVSGGELHTAVQAGFPVERIHFHGNNKSLEEISYALDIGIGTFIVDNFYELQVLEHLAAEKEKSCHVMLRITPGVEAHTHEYITTGQEDSKFGFDLGSGAVRKAIDLALKKDHLQLIGLHMHIGSQIFETTGFQIAIERVADVYREVLNTHNLELPVVNLGGGLGIRYTSEDTPLKIEHFVSTLTDVIQQEFSARNLHYPEIWLEPGRSIVATAGTTLYTVGSRKEIPGVRTYLAVDGGMSDNLRPALYQAKYEATIANRMNQPHDEVVSIAGKCCESGDMLIWDIPLPKTEPGDILAVSCTGAYHYSMANNYNRIARPAVVFVKDGRGEIVVRRESAEDIVRCDRIPDSLRA